MAAWFGWDNSSVILIDSNTFESFDFLSAIGWVRIWDTYDYDI